MANSNQPLILIIDDEQAILKTLQDALTDEDYKVITLDEGQKALHTIGEIIPDLILLDIFMPNCNGLKLLSQIKKEFPDQKIIIISGFGNIPIAIEAIKNGAIDFIEKPLNLDEILHKISFLKEKLTPENYRDVLTPLLTKGGGQGFVVNLSVDVCSLSIMKLSRELKALYVDTVIEPWPGFYFDKKYKTR